MSDGKPRSSREVAEQLHFTHRAAESVCYRGWKAGLLLRAAKPIRERNRTFAGRAGSRYNTRSYYLFILQNGSDETAGGKPKISLDSRKRRELLRQTSRNSFSAFCEKTSTELSTPPRFQDLKDQGITIRDIAANLRRYEKRATSTSADTDQQSMKHHSQAGYIVTYLDSAKSRSRRSPKPYNEPSYCSKAVLTSIRWLKESE